MRRRTRRRLAALHLEEESFEVGRDLDVHGRRRGRADATHLVAAALDRAVQDVVGVGGHDQLRIGNPIRMAT
jgi:hypothetical protein